MFIPAKKKENVLKPVEVQNLVLVENEGVNIILQISSLAKAQMVEETVPLIDFSPAVLERILRKNGGYFKDIKSSYRYVMQCVENVLLFNTKLKMEGKPALVEQCYKDLGWAVLDGQLVFKGDQVYAKDSTIFSTYAGRRDIFPSGDVEAVIGLLRENIVGNTPMEAVLCMGVAATALPYANLFWDVHVYNPICHLVGDSTTGKSTATDLFVSLGGNPQGRNSNLLSFSSTVTAILRNVAGVRGFPVGIDEFSATSRKEFSEFIYTLSNGQQLERCTGVWTAKIVEGCETVILSNGESDILSRCSQNTGLRVRLFEFQIEETWTRNAQESETIKAVVSRNYGWITPMVAQELLRNGGTYRKVFKEWVSRVRLEVQRKEIKLICSDRIANTIALFMTSCELAIDVLGLSIDIKKVFDFFFLHMIVRNADDASLGQTAYEALKRHFATNRTFFPSLIKSVSGTYEMQPEDKGFVVESRKGHVAKDGQRYISYIVFRPEEVHEVLRRAGFSSTKVALQGINKMGLLRKHDGGRLTLTISVNDVSTSMYAIWAHVDSALIFDSGETTDADEDW